jgi:hypothetical protein
MVAPTCFDITLPSSGIVPSAFWEKLNWGAVDIILWMGVLCSNVARVEQRATLLGLPSGVFPSGFPTKTLYTPLPFLIRATFPAHLILDFITRTIVCEQYRWWSSSLWSFLHSLCYLVPIRPKYSPQHPVYCGTIQNEIIKSKLYHVPNMTRERLQSNETTYILVISVKLITRQRDGTTKDKG